MRTCHGAPETRLAPSAAPPAWVSQNEDWARWPPHARSTALPVVVKDTRISTLLFPDADPECTGALIDAIEPPQSVNRRDMPA